MLTKFKVTEAPEEIEDKKGSSSDGVSGEGSAMFNQQQYHVGDFVYVANKEVPGGESKIFLIEKIYRTNPHLSNGIWMMAVNQFFRYFSMYNPISIHSHTPFPLYQIATFIT